MKILIVDDDEISQKVVKRVLERLDYEDILASDGKQAWEVFDAEPVPVVISDWVMPDMSGLALCQKIRKRPQTDYTYFILLTGTLTGKYSYMEAMEAGVDDFLTKPLDPVVLQGRLRVAERILSLMRQVKQLEGLLDVCAYCKRIRHKGETYEDMEAYIRKSTLADFSHTICPDCAKKHFPEVNLP
ncbi:MAG: response regulator [Elusimicrobia bacterium]|nr:response regulator [Elusimicrobiota bacterium]